MKPSATSVFTEGHTFATELNQTITEERVSELSESPMKTKKKINL